MHANKALDVYGDVIESDKDLLKFAENLCPTSKLVTIPVFTPSMPLNNCYWNVDLLVRKHGGSSVLGWRFSATKHSHILAVHHAVYHTPEGEVVDVTAQDNFAYPKGKTVFLPDDSIPIDVSTPSSIECKFHITNNNLYTRNYIDSYKRFHNLEVKFAEALKNAGYKNQNQFALAEGRQPVPHPFTLEQGKDLTSIQEMMKKRSAQVQNSLQLLHAFISRGKKM
ncbi:hypothetical protein ACYZFV_01530 [Serratia ureilytica]